MSAAGAVSQAVAAELLHCELQLMLQEAHQNGKLASTLLAADFVAFGSMGRVFSRSDALAAVASGAYEAPIVEDFQCRKLAAGVVLVTYRAVNKQAETGEEQSTLRSSVWTKHKKGWVVRFYQGTPASAVSTSRPHGA